VRRTASGAAGNGLGTTIKYLRQTTAAGSRLTSTIKYLRDAAGIGLSPSIKYLAQGLCVEPELPPCVHKHIPHQHTFSFSSRLKIISYIKE
jgi:hypothetical protein